MDAVERGRALRQAGDLDGAGLVLARALAALEAERALVFEAKGDADSALQAAERATAADPASLAAWEALAELHERAGRPEAAEVAWRHMSAAAYRAGDHAGSDRAARRALTLYPVRLAGGGADLPRLLVLYGCRRTSTFFIRPDCVYQRSSFSTAGFLDCDGYELATAFVGLTAEMNLKRPVAILNGIADADGEPEALVDAAEFVDFLGVPAINHPRRVAATTRDGVWRTINDIDGVVMGRTVRARCDDPDHPRLDRVIAEADMRYPVLVRPIATQTGEGLLLLEDEAQAKAAVLDARYAEMYVIQYIECRSDDGWWRKSRLFIVDGVIYPDHHVIADQWNSRIRTARPMMRRNPAMVAEEIDFLENCHQRLGPARVAAIEEMHRRFGLDYFGIDCNLLPDGRLFVFEANPCMRRQHHEVSQGDTYLVAPMAAVTAAFKRMVQSRLGIVPP
jgi:hypothetical protein